MKVEQLLSSLRKVRKTGSNRWVACCPAHEDKSPSMTVTVKPNTILIHCFSGCSVESILGAVGMTFDDLYPDTRTSCGPSSIPVSDALRCISFETLVVTASAGTMRQRQLTEAEMSRLIQASSRIQAALQLSGVAN